MGHHEEIPPFSAFNRDSSAAAVMTGASFSMNSSNCGSITPTIFASCWAYSIVKEQHNRGEQDQNIPSHRAALP